MKGKCILLLPVSIWLLLNIQGNSTSEANGISKQQRLSKLIYVQPAPRISEFHFLHRDEQAHNIRPRPYQIYEENPLPLLQISNVSKTLGICLPMLKIGTIGSQSKESDIYKGRKISLRTSLLTLKDLDTGRYKALVIQDTTDKRKVRGFFHLTEVISPSMLELVIPLYRDGFTVGLYNYVFGLRKLVEAINTYTDLQADFGPRRAMSDQELAEIPWIFIANGKPFYPTRSELRNLGRYLVGGGFVLFDAGSAIGGELDVNCRYILKEALAEVGKPCDFYRVKGDHPIFHSFFDFDTIPVVRDLWAGRSDLSFPEYLLGVDVDGRLAAVLSYAELGKTWNAYSPVDSYNLYRSKYYRYLRSLQFGINTIIYALTQKGSITQNIMATKIEY